MAKYADSAAVIRCPREEARSFLRRAADNLALLPESIHRHALQGLCEFVVRRTF